MQATERAAKARANAARERSNKARAAAERKQKAERRQKARLAERAAYEMAAQSMRDAACAKQVIEESRRAAVASAEYLSVKAEARALDEEVGRLNKAAERPDRCWECAGCAKLKVGARRWLEEGFLYSSAFFTLRLSFTLRCLPLPCGHLPALPPRPSFSLYFSEYLKYFRSISYPERRL